MKIWHLVYINTINFYTIANYYWPCAIDTLKIYWYTKDFTTCLEREGKFSNKWTRGCCVSKCTGKVEK